MGNNIDWKKLIQMVAIIGALCLIVGIMTRVIQKSQTSLNDYAKKNPEVAYATPEEETDGDEDADTENEDGKESSKDKDSKENKSDKESKAGEITAQDIYDNFYYTDETDGYKFHLMYYTSKHEVSTAELEFNAENPEEALKLFYDLFKAEHEFSSISDLQRFADKLSVQNSEDDENTTPDEAIENENSENNL